MTTHDLDELHSKRPDVPSRAEWAEAFHASTRYGGSPGDYLRGLYTDEQIEASREPAE